MQSSDKTKEIDRYPGPRPFDEPEKHLFFGRSTETDELFDMICACNVVLIHAESGLGKSSLINASLIPKLRENSILPLIIRFSERENPPLKQFLEVINKAAKANNIKYLQTPEDNVLWLSIKLLNKYGHTPVFIFDQFEEFFYYDKPAREELIKEISFALGSRVPTNFPEVAVAEKKESESNFLWFTRPEFKLLFSLRSDRLGLMEDLSKHIPAILKNRFQLKPITADRSEQAIVVPAMLDTIDEVKFNSKPFDFEQELIKKIVEVVKDGKKDTIDSTQLQMICQEIENISKQKKSNKPLITIHDLNGEDGLQELVKNFYTKQLLKIRNETSVSNDEFNTIQKLLETKLIVGKQRVLLSSVVVKDFLSECNISESGTSKLIDLLQNYRLIRYQIYGESGFYEISHDKFIEPILIEKSKREFKERVKREKEEALEAEKAERKKLKEEQARQIEEIKNQKKFIQQIQDEKIKAEAAEKTAKEASENAFLAERKARDAEEVAKKNETIARDALQKFRKEKKKNFFYVGSIILFLVISASILFYLYKSTDKYKDKIIGQVATISDFNAKNAYDKGNHILAYAFWKNALKLTPEATYIKEKLENNFFAPFAGTDIKLSEDNQYIGTQYANNELVVWTRRNDGQIIDVFKNAHISSFNFLNGREILWYITDTSSLFLYNLKKNKTTPYYNDSTSQIIDTLKITNVKQLENDLMVIFSHRTSPYLFFIDLKEMKISKHLTNSILKIIEGSKFSDNMIDNVANYDSLSIILYFENYLYRINKQAGEVIFKEYLLPPKINYTYNTALTKMAYINNQNLIVKDFGGESSVYEDTGISPNDNFVFIKNDSSLLVSKQNEINDRHSYFTYEFSTNKLTPIHLGITRQPPFFFFGNKLFDERKNYFFHIDETNTLHISAFSPLKDPIIIENVSDYLSIGDSVIVMLENNEIKRIDLKTRIITDLPVKAPPNHFLDGVYGLKYIKFKNRSNSGNYRYFLQYQDSLRNSIDSLHHIFNYYIEKELDQAGVVIEEK